MIIKINIERVYDFVLNFIITALDTGIGATSTARVFVNEGYADRLKIGATYTIGHMYPNSLRIETCNTEHRTRKDMSKRIREIIGLSVPEMIDNMQLFEFKNYQQTARNGHFGHPEFPWEQVK